MIVLDLTLAVSQTQESLQGGADTDSLHVLIASLILAFIAMIMGCSIAPFALAAGPDQPLAITADELTYQNLPDLPLCVTVGVASGDPMSGPSTVVLRLTAKCRTGLHWHSANEQIVMIKGSGVLQSQGGAPKTLAAGAYAMQPSKHPHRFTCDAGGECVLYLMSGGKFDIHYIDNSGSEITLEEAQRQAGKM